MAETATTLDELWHLAWERLRQGKDQSRSPFHQGVLATQAEQGPEARYVVLRQADEQNTCVCFHTDIRSSKVQQIKNSPRLSWCFYGDGLQLRLQGTAQLHQGNAIARDGWQQASPMSQRAYLGAQAPGTVLSQPEHEKSVTLGNIALSAKENGISFTHFMLVQIQVLELEVLSLKSSGHLRALFSIQADDRRAQWLAP
jgi:pyridoxamine 5'-phosphate oxidase